MNSLNYISRRSGLAARSAISIIEIMIFIAVLSIAVIGTSGYRYFSTMDIRRSDNEITAGRIASQLCESWKGVGGGDSSYNPIIDTGIGLVITASSSTLAPEKPAAFSLLKSGGYYKVVSDDRTYYATMSYLTIKGPKVADPNLETLNVIVNWPANENSTDSDAAKKSICLSELLIAH